MSAVGSLAVETTHNDTTSSIELRTANTYFEAIILLAEDSTPASNAVTEHFASIGLRKIVDAVRTVIGRKLVMWKTRAQEYKSEADRLLYDTSGAQGNMLHHAEIAKRHVTDETKRIEDAKTRLKQNGHGMLLEYVEEYCRDPRSRTDECFSMVDKFRDDCDQVAHAETKLIDSCEQQLNRLKDTAQLTLREIDNIKTDLNKKRPRLDCK